MSDLFNIDGLASAIVGKLAENPEALDAFAEAVASKIGQTSSNGCTVFLDRPEVERRLKTSRTGLHELDQAGLLKAHKMRGKIVYVEDQVEEFCQRVIAGEVVLKPSSRRAA